MKQRNVLLLLLAVLWLTLTVSPFAEPPTPKQADQDFRVTDGVGCTAHLAPSGRGVVLESSWPRGADLHYCWQESPDFANASARGSCTREGFRSTGPLAHGQKVTVLQDSPRPSTSDGFIKAGLVCYACGPGDPKQTCRFGLNDKSSSQYNFLSAEQSAKLEGRDGITVAASADQTTLECTGKNDVGSTWTWVIRINPADGWKITDDYFYLDRASGMYNIIISRYSGTFQAQVFALRGALTSGKCNKVTAQDKKF
ncbi:hypothetical protein P0D71_11250 [Paraburkholderia sp. RL17-383-BIF-A]|uniref:hypothetical protein n=1 Tax=Paraburkholderia sp. RL17-383-BIF-A TaxID=3031631 RepID=UPI0038B781E0